MFQKWRKGEERKREGPEEGRGAGPWGAREGPE